MEFMGVELENYDSWNSNRYFLEICIFIGIYFLSLF